MIDFAKALVGMTHYDTQTERFCFVNGNSVYYEQDFGSDRLSDISPVCLVGSAYEHRYIKKIPVREIKLNEYADVNEWVDGMPPVGCECKCSVGDREIYPIVVEAYSIDKSEVMIRDLETGSCVCWTIHQIEFYEIETEAQKAEREVRELARAIEKAGNDIEKLAYANPSIVAAKAAIEWFKNKS